MKPTVLSTILILFLVFASCTKNENTLNTKESFNIAYEKFTLENGLEVILHVDKSYLQID